MVKNRVHAWISKEFYNNIDLERKKFNKNKNVGLKISEFTDYMAKRKVQFKFPKNKFMPKNFDPLPKKRRKGLFVI